jgi:hypothetical protein
VGTFGLNAAGRSRAAEGGSTLTTWLVFELERDVPHAYSAEGLGAGHQNPPSVGADRRLEVRRHDGNVLRDGPDMQVVDRAYARDRVKGCTGSIE